MSFPPASHAQIRIQWPISVVVCLPLFFCPTATQAQNAGKPLSPSTVSTTEPAATDSLTTCSRPQPAITSGHVYRAYSGCSLPRNQVAILNLRGTVNVLGYSATLRAKSIDGISTYNDPPHGKEKNEHNLDNSASVELRPGRHTIRFVLLATQNGTNSGTYVETFKESGAKYSIRYTDIEVEQDIDMEAGTTYAAIPRTQDSGRIIRISGQRTIPEREFWVEVAEFQNTPATYLQLSEEDLKKGDSAAALSALESYLALFPKDPKYKAVEEMARKLRASLNNAQLDAYRIATSGPAGPAAKRTAIPEILTCGSEQSTQRSRQPESMAMPLSMKMALDPQAAPDLKQVLARAAHYVEEYEMQLGNLIAEEIYVQNAAPVKATKIGTMIPGGVGKQQRTESDFAILHVGQDWIGVREVHCVDGVPVQRQAENFQKIVDDSSIAVMKTVESILHESARYNIGLIQRNTNLPTFALRILRMSNTPRFEFKKTGEMSIGGIHTWAVSFRELQGPTLIRDGDNHEEFANGTLWIEPETGRILKTEVNDAGHQGQISFRAQTVVSYKNDPKLKMLVPFSMEEHYDTDGSRKLDCRADYFNFRRFQVETHLDFGLEVTPGNSPLEPPPIRPIP